MADAQPAAMQAGVVNVLLTVDPVASHAAGTYVTWDGVAFDEGQTARCDAATPHELWAWTVTTDEAPGAAAEPRADVRRLTTIVAGASGHGPGGVQRRGARALRRLPGPRGTGPGGQGIRGERGVPPLPGRLPPDRAAAYLP